MLLVDIIDGDRCLRTVAAGLNAKMLEPLIGVVTKTVHRAVKMHGRDRLVRIENALHHSKVLVSGGALVVNDQVVTLGPIILVINRQGRFDCFVICPPNIDSGISTCLDSLEENFVLRGIVVAAASSNEENFQWWLFLLCGEQRNSNNGDADCEQGRDDSFHERRGSSITKGYESKCRRLEKCAPRYDPFSEE